MDQVKTVQLQAVVMEFSERSAMIQAYLKPVMMVILTMVMAVVINVCLKHLVLRPILALFLIIVT